jgi:predicted acyltransferase
MNTNKIDFTQRNVAIDILRALTMLLMIFVNDLWSIKGEPDWLGHAKSTQDFLGLADTVFPCFLFVVGMSIPFAIESRFSKGLSGVSTVGHILSRSLALLLMGVFIVNTESGISKEIGISMPIYRILMVTAFFLIWNMYPKSDKPITKYLYPALKIIGLLLLIYLAIVFRNGKGDVMKAGWWGILGIIGWTYLVCAFVYLFTRDRLKYLIPIWLLFLLICFVKNKTREGGLILDLPRGNFLDEFLDILHIGNGASVALTMGGILLSLISARYINADNRKKIIFAVTTVCGLLVAGYLSHQVWIVSKIQATTPWVFYCSAIAVGVYALIYWLVEKGKAHWFNIIKTAGTATLTCYLVPYIAYSVSSLLHIRLPEFLKTGFVGILNCIVFAFMIVGITYLIGRIHIKLKI